MDAQVVFVDEARQFAVFKHGAVDVVVPYALPECGQLAQRVFVFGGGDCERIVRVFAQFVACNHRRGDGCWVVQQRDEAGGFGVRRRQRFDFGKGRCFFRCGRSLCGFRRIVT